MKRILFLVIFMVGWSFITKADTLDFCHVYYNHLKRWDFINYNGQYKIEIKSVDVKMEDSIQIYYFDDTPCYGCKGEMKVLTETQQCVVNKTMEYYTYAVNDLLKLYIKNGRKELHIVYLESPGQTKAFQIFLIKFE
ncbi:MAG: hypothetical protein PSX81_00370 [bacterium]|nr:hypothetical protein [bacterium]